MITYKYYCILSILYFVILSPSRAGVYAYYHRYCDPDNTYCKAGFICGFVGAGICLLVLIHKLYKKYYQNTTGGRPTNLAQQFIRGRGGRNNNANLRPIASDIPVTNTRSLNSELSTLQVNNNRGRNEPSQLSELAAFDSLYLRESNLGTDNTRRQWVSLAASESAASTSAVPTRGLSQEHTILQMNSNENLELTQQELSDIAVPPPPYSAKP